MSAPIELITGLPGNGKTLYAIKYVKEWSERDSRPVFYHGIALGDDLASKWTKIDPEKWFEAPPGAIIIIDECQIIFRPRSLGKEPPAHVSKLETIRHQGLNMVLITQHPLLADASIRRLTGKHMHCIRKWGTESSTIHEWASVRDNCDKPAGRKDSIKHAWKFDKSVYALYKSAEVHTIKRRIPARVWMLLTIPFLLAGAAYLVWYMMIGKKQQAAPVAVPGQIQQGAMTQQPRQKEKWEDPVADARRYAYEATPRIVGMAHTAPKYDAVTQPTTAPMPTSCVASKTRCQCYSQQATVMAVEEITCRSIVERGYFVDFGRDQDKSNQAQISQANYTRADAVQVEQPPQRPVVVAAASEDGYGILGKRGEGVRKRVAEHNALTN
jgi:zona occludens toxin